MFYFQLPGRDYEYHAPTQSPIDPPYKEACQLRKTDKLAKPNKQSKTGLENEIITTDSDNNFKDNVDDKNAESDKLVDNVTEAESEVGGACGGSQGNCEQTDSVSGLDDACDQVSKLVL